MIRKRRDKLGSGARPSLDHFHDDFAQQEIEENLIV